MAGHLQYLQLFLAHPAAPSFFSLTFALFFYVPTIFGAMLFPNNDGMGYKQVESCTSNVLKWAVFNDPLISLVKEHAVQVL